MSPQARDDHFPYYVNDKQMNNKVRGGGIGLYTRSMLDVPLKIHPKSWVGYTSFFHQKEMIYQRSSKSNVDVVIHVIQIRRFQTPNTFMA